MNKDGTSKLSEIKQLDFSLDRQNIIVFPNPAKDELFVSMKPFTGRSANIQIFDSHAVRKAVFQLDEAGEELLRIPLDGYRNGIYMMLIQAEGKRKIARRFIVEKLY
ncbi:MAG: T9SS type A sorting domain-containing protein [Bacteroidetes bacterium]|nr:T9SS type A sorting domain-containing protein [Bacteroidota bacterium]